MKTTDSTATRTHWSTLRVWWLTSGEGGSVECTDSERLEALRELRDTGGMYLRVLVDPADYGPDCEPLSGEGPRLEDAGPADRDIDWAGFDLAHGGQS